MTEYELLRTVVAVALVGMTTFIATALFVYKPIIEQLKAERDAWKDRALEGEDSPDAQLEGMRVIDQAGWPMPWEEDDE